MAIKTTSKTKKSSKFGNKGVKSPIKSVAPKVINSKQLQKGKNNSQIISGYFIEDQSYKQMIIERVNTFLYCTLGSLILICTVAYYFVTVSEIKLNQIQKETLSINYSNEELQNQLDNIQSYHNVDKTVTKTNILHIASQIMELPEKTIPAIKADSIEEAPVKSWSLGY